MKSLFYLLVIINCLSTVWCAPNTVWIGNIFSSVMNNFSIVPQDSNSTCSLQNEIYKTNLENGIWWAVEMYDATAKDIGGLLNGNTDHFGYPDQCVQTTVPEYNINGKYCFVRGSFVPSKGVDTHFYNSSHSNEYPPYDKKQTYWDAIRFKTDVLWVMRNKINWGICIPDSCTREDLIYSLNQTFLSVFEENGITFQLNITENDCYTQHEMDNRPLPLGATIWLKVLLALVFITSTATSYDWFLRENMIKEKKRLITLEYWILPFSIINNTERLFKASVDDEFEVIYGLKAVAMAILVFGHRGMTIFGNRLSNMNRVEEVFRDIRYTMVNNGTIVVDTFLFFGAYITADRLVNMLKTKGKINLIFVYLDRILRIYPAYIFIITYYMYIMPLIGEGPRWKEIAFRESSRCNDNWWTNLLFINTFVEPEHMCMLQSWYISADMQMFFFSVPIIYFIWLHPKWKVSILSILMGIAIIIPAVLTFEQNNWGMFPMNSDLFYDPPSVPMYINLYIQSYARYIPYIFGISSLFLSLHLKKINYRFSVPLKVVLGLGSFVAVVVFCFVFVSVHFYKENYIFNLMENAIYSSFHRIIWSLFMASMVVVHRANRLGLISDLFGLKIWVPLSRMSLSMYLTHIAVFLYSVSTEQKKTHITTFLFFVHYFGGYMFSCLVALLVNYIIESPSDIYSKRLKDYILGSAKKSMDSALKVETDNSLQKMHDSSNGKKVNGDFPANENIILGKIDYKKEIFTAKF